MFGIKVLSLKDYDNLVNTNTLTESDNTRLTDLLKEEIAHTHELQRTVRILREERITSKELIDKLMAEAKGSTDILQQAEKRLGKLTVVNEELQKANEALQERNDNQCATIEGMRTAHDELKQRFAKANETMETSRQNRIDTSSEIDELLKLWKFRTENPKMPPNARKTNNEAIEACLQKLRDILDR